MFGCDKRDFYNNEYEPVSLYNQDSRAFSRESVLLMELVWKIPSLQSAAEI